MLRDGPHRLAEQVFVPLAQPAHHSQVEKDDLPLPDAEVPRMGIRVEEAVVDDLLDIIVRQLEADFLQVVAVVRQNVRPIQIEALDGRW